MRIALMFALCVGLDVGCKAGPSAENTRKNDGGAQTATTDVGVSPTGQGIGVGQAARDCPSGTSVRCAESPLCEKWCGCETPSGTKHGRWTGWHKNGRKARESEFRDDTLHGLFTTYFENGRKAREGEFRDDKQHGLWTVWDENGQKVLEGEFRDDKRHGRETTWHENGEKSGEGEFRDDKPCGTWLQDGSVGKEEPPCRPL